MALNIRCDGSDLATYSAMTANRPYRKALCREHAVAELKRCSGTQFDPDLVEVFINEVV